MARTAALARKQVPAGSKPTLDAFTKTIGFTPVDGRRCALRRKPPRDTRANVFGCTGYDGDFI
jgi:hypothetical protein